MTSRIVRVLSLMAGAGAVACVLVAISATASPAGATPRGSANSGQLVRCAKTVLGLGRPPATPVVASADPQLIARLAIFRRTRSRADALAAVSGLRAALAATHARTYDPSAAVRLTHGHGGDAVYAVPATMSAPTAPADCAGLPQLAGAGALVALQTDESGSGPGACLISTQLQARTPSSLTLPGMRSPRPKMTVVATATACKSATVLFGYLGALGDPLGPKTRLALIPDGVNAITYALANGHQITVPVPGNLVRIPAAVVSFPPTPRLQTAQLGQALAAHLPTTVTEQGAGINPPLTLTRPVSYIPDAVGAYSFLRRLLRRSSGVSGASSTGTESVSCSARTHACVAVSVTTNCDSYEHCRTSRTIVRYRYVGARPPRGTTGPQTLPTAPIVARTNRDIVRPRRLTLVLTGAPQRVVVVLSVSCFSRNGGAGGGGPVLTLAVPSRTPVALPGPARSFRACNVSALVTSSRRSPVHVTVARG